MDPMINYVASHDKLVVISGNLGYLGLISAQFADLQMKFLSLLKHKKTQPLKWLCFLATRINTFVFLSEILKKKIITYI